MAGLRETAGERIRVSEASEGGPRPDFPLLKEREASFSRTDGPVEVPPHEVNATECAERLGQREWMGGPLCEPPRLLGASDPFGKSSLVRQSQSEPRARPRGEEGRWKT